MHRLVIEVPEAVSPSINAEIAGRRTSYKEWHGWIVESGEIYASYNPLAYPQILNAFYKLDGGADMDITAFAGLWGLPIFDRPPRSVLAPEFEDGESLTFIRRHAANVRFLLDVLYYIQDGDLQGLTDHVNLRTSPSKGKRTLRYIAGERDAEAAIGLEFSREGLLGAAGEIINANASGGGRGIGFVVDGHPQRPVLVAHNVLPAIYWFAAQALSGVAVSSKTLGKCPECQSVFLIAREGTQYCPPLNPWSKSESWCAVKRRKARQRSAASSSGDQGGADGE